MAEISATSVSVSGRDFIFLIIASVKLAGTINDILKLVEVRERFIAGLEGTKSPSSIPKETNRYANEIKWYYYVVIIYSLFLKGYHKSYYLGK